MHSKSVLGISVLVLSAALQPVLAPAPAFACGGLFCNASQPVNQAAERILFVRNADDTITAVIEIKYQGPSERFSWVLPVPGVPDVAVSSTAGFDRLQAATNPQYRLQTTFESCGGQTKSATGGGAFNSADGGTNPVMVVAHGTVGPYDYEVIKVDDSASDKAQAAVDWLTANKYDLFDNGPELLRPYLADGLNLIAFRLTKDSSTGAIRPIVLTYASDYPFIPIRPTAVAANDDMGVLVWVTGQSRTIPRNYKSLELNEALINWWNPGSNYKDVVSAAADEAGGQGFVTELAQQSKTLANTVLMPDDLTAWDRAKSLTNDPSMLVLAVAERFGAWDGLPDAVTKYVTLPTGVAVEDFLSCPRCNPLPDQSSLDSKAFVAQVQKTVIDPMVDLQHLLTSRPYVTRLYTTMSAKEMTLDPLFDFNADLPEVSNIHMADAYVRCDGTYRVNLPSGGTLYGTGARMWPSDELVDAALPATRAISQLAPRGMGKVLVDNAAMIDQALTRTPSARAYLKAEGCGCSIPHRPRNATGALAVLAGLALALGRRRSHRG